MIFPKTRPFVKPEIVISGNGGALGACRRPPSGGLHSPKGRALPAAQPLLPLPRSAPARLRSVRRAFKPAPAPGPYRLPHDIRDRLATALTPYPEPRCRLRPGHLPRPVLVTTRGGTLPRA